MCYVHLAKLFSSNQQIQFLDTIESSLEYNNKLRQTIRKALQRFHLFFLLCGIRHCWQEILMAKNMMCSKFTAQTF